MIPLGIRAPTSVYLPGFARKSTISSSSSFSSLRPATSLNLFACGSSGSILLALLFPKFIIFEFPPPEFADCADRNENSKNIATKPRPYGRSVVITHDVFFTSPSLYDTFHWSKSSCTSFTSDT